MNKLTPEQERLANALQSFPDKIMEAELDWPEGYRLYEALRNLPPKVLGVSGRFLYSDISTLKRGSSTLGKCGYYILGINPGGKPDDYPVKLRCEIPLWFSKNENAYMDETWPPCISKGADPYQLDVKELCKTIGKNTREVCASNLIFERSNGTNNLCFSQLTQSFVRNIYWPVHKAVLNIVKPSVIFVFGITAYRVILGILKKECYLYPKNNEPSRCSLYIADGHCQDGHSFKLFGIPYPKYGFRLVGHPFLQKISEECCAMEGNDAKHT